MASNWETICRFFVSFEIDIVRLINCSVPKFQDFEDLATQDMQVFVSGPLSELYVLRGVLFEQGVSSWIRDETIQIVDPFITGGNVLEADLMIFCHDLEKARQCLPERKGMPPQSSNMTRFYWGALIVLVFVLPMIVALLLP